MISSEQHFGITVIQQRTLVSGTKALRPVRLITFGATSFRSRLGDLFIYRHGAKAARSFMTATIGRSFSLRGNRVGVMTILKALAWCLPPRNCQETFETWFLRRRSEERRVGKECRAR